MRMNIVNTLIKFYFFKREECGIFSFCAWESIFCYEHAQLDSEHMSVVMYILLSQCSLDLVCV